MRVAVIGGTGRVGSCLVPRLVEAGHGVAVVSRGRSEPRCAHPAWGEVERVTIDRKAAEAEGAFGRAIAELNADAVIDMVCFQPDSARQLVDALCDGAGHLVSCGSLWVHGHSVIVPTEESFPRRPICAYGRAKAAIEALLLEAAADGFPATVLHAGHIVSAGDQPLTPVGNKDMRVFAALARGEELRVPNLGMETLHHVHADDLAQAFVAAVERRDAAAGNSFHVAGPWAVTMRGYAETVAAWFGKEARLTFVPWPQWAEGAGDEWAAQTWDHLAHSPNASIAKARRLLGYEPRYDTFEAVREAVAWLVENDRIEGVRSGDWA